MRAGQLIVALLLAGCRSPDAPTLGDGRSQVSNQTYERAGERRAMVERQLAARGIDDSRVLAAMLAVPRHRFMPESMADRAYDDGAQPIGHGVTISQPYIVALMTQLADVQPGEAVLEVGTGSGYQAAVLAELGAKVYSIERIDALARTAAATLRSLGYEVEVRHGDGYLGWPERAPFAAILLTAAPPTVPSAARSARDRWQTRRARRARSGLAATDRDRANRARIRARGRARCRVRADAAGHHARLAAREFS